MSGERPDTLLAVEDLVVRFDTDEGVVHAVNGVTLEVAEGETLGLVGESGCGKSVTALSLLRLVPTPPGRIVSGEVRLRGRDLLALPPGEMRRVRGRDIAMIFQEPMTSLNPVFTIGYQIEEAVRLHQGKRGREARELAAEMLRRVGMSHPERRLREYPHQFSGGMKQRAMIAMALVCRPALLIADEPTTALDVTIQAQILDLLRELQRDLGMAILLITHDMGVVAEMADRVAVMYAGRIVEAAPAAELFAAPLHPYTRALLECIPTVTGERKKLRVIEGQVPDPTRLPAGCAFRPRCPIREPAGEEAVPPLREVKPGHWVACHHV